MKKDYLVFWSNGDDLGLYPGETPTDAILAAVQDAGYRDLNDAVKFIYDKNGQLAIEAKELPL